MVGIGLAASLLLTTTLAHGDSFPFANKEQEVDYRTQNSEDGKTAACPGPGASGAYPLDAYASSAHAGCANGANARLRAEL